MNLYRMTYIREGKPRGTTFAHKDAASATQFAEVWAQAIKATLLTVVKVRPLQPQLELELT